MTEAAPPVSAVVLSSAPISRVVARPTGTSVCRQLALFLFHLDDLAPPVGAAAGTNPVRKHQLLALWAQHQMGQGQRMMASPPIASAARDLSLRDRSHSLAPSLNVPPRGRARRYYRGKRSTCQGCAPGPAEGVPSWDLSAWILRSPFSTTRSVRRSSSSSWQRALKT
jgi:hypothetical protein